MRHLRKLMAATAVAGLAAATSRGTASALKPPPRPDAGADAGADAEADAGTDGDVDGGVPVPLPYCDDPNVAMSQKCSGYGVVDPLPPPARGCGCHQSPGMAEE
jgi:hypothetical protein